MIEAGPFHAGEKPGQITYPFTDSTGAAINLTGFTVKFHYKRVGASAVTRNGVLVTPASGLVGYTPVAADLETDGIYKAHFEVGNGTNRYLSDDIVYRVKPYIVAGTT